jgi:hypothetical protein
MKNAEFMEILLLLFGKSFHYPDYREAARLKAII